MSAITTSLKRWHRREGSQRTPSLDREVDPVGTANHGTERHRAEVTTVARPVGRVPPDLDGSARRVDGRYALDEPADPALGVVHDDDLAGLRKAAAKRPGVDQEPVAGPEGGQHALIDDLDASAS